MKRTLWAILALGCSTKPASSPGSSTDTGITDTGVPNTIVYVDGEAYSLTLTPVLPANQANLFTQIDSLQMLVTQADGTQSTHDLLTADGSDDRTAADVPFLDDATLELAGYNGARLTLYGRSAPLTVSEGEVDARLTVARVDDMAQLDELSSGQSQAPLIATGDGRFYLFGGASGGMFEQDPTRTILRLDIATPRDTLEFVDTEVKLPAITDGGRMGHTATVLGDSGKVLIAGGVHRYFTETPTWYAHHGDVTTSANAFLFDPQTEDTEELGDLNYARAGHIAVENDDGNVLLIGGFVNPAEQPWFSAAQLDIFEPATGTFVSEGSTDLLLSSGTAMHAGANLPGEGVLVCGGIGYAEDFIEDCTLIDSTYAPSSRPGPGKALVAPAMTTLDDGRILLTGGLDASSSSFNDGALGSLYSNTIDAVSDAYVYEGGSWRALASMNIDRAWHSAVLLPDGQVLIAGGVTGVIGTGTDSDAFGVMFHPSEAIACAELFNPSTETFTPIDTCDAAMDAATLPARSFLQAAAVDPIHGALIVGGIGSDGNAVPSASLYRSMPDL